HGWLTGERRCSRIGHLLRAARRGHRGGCGVSDNLVFAVPSKGRLMEQTAEFLAAHGMMLRKVGHERGYRGVSDGLDGVDVVYVSASEIAEQLKSGRAHLGVTGEDLVRDLLVEPAGRVTSLKQLGFGQADVVVAVPAAWLDVWR